MKKLFLILALVYSSTSPVSAITNDELISACRRIGSLKVHEQASSWSCRISGEVQVEEIDNRWWNPSKYILFAAPVQDCTHDVTTVRKMVQYYDGKCF